MVETIETIETDAVKDDASCNTINIPELHKLIFTKVRSVKTPKRAHPTDAGMDFYCPEFNYKFILDLIEKNLDTKFDVVYKNTIINYKNYKLPNIIELFNNEDTSEYEPGQIVLYPGERIVIPSGIKIKNMVYGSALIAFNKSGVATKDGLTKMAEVVDENYLGEIHISVLNTSNLMTVGIIENLKIIQFIHVPVIYSDLHEVDNNEFNKYESDRNDGAFGSTGLK